MPSRLKQELTFLPPVVVDALLVPGAAFFGLRLVLRSLTRVDKWVLLEVNAPCSQTIVVVFCQKFNSGCHKFAAKDGVLVPSRLRLHCV